MENSEAAGARHDLPAIMARLGIGAETLREPLCVDPADSWLGHVPFVFWLIHSLRPLALVELGAPSPVSHLASCQAIEADALPTQAHALASSDPAQPPFAQGSVDLLILRDAPLADQFDRWRPALSSRAVVLLDRTGGPGPARALWTQLAGTHPHFEFPHAGGLGVVGLGSDLPPRVEALFALAADADAAALVRRYFSARGAVAEGSGALEAARRRAARAALEQATHVNALQTRYRNRLNEAYRHLSTWLDQSLQRYDHWMRGEIHRSRVEIERSQAEVGHWIARVGEVAAERDEARREFATLLASTSWRVTAPLRSAMGRLGGGRTSPVAEPAAIPPASEPTAEARPPFEPAPAPALPPPPDLRPILPDLFALREHRAAARLAVVLHVRHPETVGAALASVALLPEPFALFVLLVDDRSEHLAPSIRDQWPEAHVFSFPDRGRDALPLLALATTGALFQYELVCTCDTSPADGPQDVSPALTQAAGLLPAFDRDPDLGLVVDGARAAPAGTCWQPAAAGLHRLLPRLGLSLDRPPAPDLVSGPVSWFRPWVLRDLVALRLQPDDFDLEPTGDPVAADAVRGLIAVACRSAALTVQTVSATLSMPPPAAASASAPPIVAFYLPQFHPTPENDRWWGAGFTEWTNVTSAQPLFPGHRQPRLPGELGFVDLRLAETRRAQAALARAYGIGAFCYYYYWFGAGRRLLSRPLDEVRHTGEPDFPFLICWANEPWSRRWDGSAEDVLVAQDYAPGWEQAFAADVAPILQDARYLRAVDGRPFLLIYRVMQLPDPAASLKLLRRHLADLGAGPVHLACGRFSLAALGDTTLPDDPTSLGCDSYFEFPPHGLPTAPVPPSELPPDLTGHVFDYARTVDRAIERLDQAADDRALHHGVMASWDNTALRGAAAHVYRGATPCHLRRWLRAIVLREQARTDGAHKLVFVNAWNEWAEGTYLEPDRDFGRGWLEAVRSALGRG